MPEEMAKGTSSFFPLFFNSYSTNKKTVTAQREKKSTVMPKELDNYVINFSSSPS